MIYFEGRKPSLFVLVKRSLYICGGAEFEMEVDLLEFSLLWLFLLMLLQHLLPHLIFNDCGRVEDTLSASVHHLRSGNMYYYSPIWGLYYLLVAPFDCFCLLCIVSNCFSDFPIFLLLGSVWPVCVKATLGCVLTDARLPVFGYKNWSAIFAVSVYDLGTALTYWVNQVILTLWLNAPWAVLLIPKKWSVACHC